MFTTQFTTCFTSTKVQILTLPKNAGAPGASERVHHELAYRGKFTCFTTSSVYLLYFSSSLIEASLLALPQVQFTCFTTTQILLCRVRGKYTKKI